MKHIKLRIANGVGVVAGTLLVAGCGASSVPSSSSAAALAVTSSLDGLTTLPHRIHWTATPNVSGTRVSKVEFLIDGRLGWVEQQSPYFYGSDGNYLVTSFLTPGLHSFAVKVTASDGRTATRTVRASVAAAAPSPTVLAGTWQRTVTAEDQMKATSGMPPPAGVWRLVIDAVGWTFSDPVGGGIRVDAEYISFGNVEMRPTIEEPPYPNTFNGAMCDEPDPPFTYLYVSGAPGSTLTIRSAGSDPCGDRSALMEGTWTRAS